MSAGDLERNERKSTQDLSLSLFTAFHDHISFRFLCEKKHNILFHINKMESKINYGNLVFQSFYAVLVRQSCPSQLN